MSLKVIEEADWLRRASAKIETEYEPTDWIKSGPREDAEWKTILCVLIAAKLFGFFPSVAMDGCVQILLLVAVIRILEVRSGK